MTASPIIPPELQRKLVAYRITLGLAIVLLFAMLVGRGLPERADATLRIVRLDQLITHADVEMKDVSDSVFRFFHSKEGTVHMHVLHQGQICPLHIHRKSREATLIIAGDAHVGHLFGGDKAQTLLTAARPGMLIESPPFCAHSWKNATRGLQANLVFESPPFDGNLYLEDANRALATGPAPTISDIQAEFQSFAASHEGVRQRPTATPRLSLLLVRQDYSIAANPSGPLAVYVVEGQGTIAPAARSAESIEARELVVETETHDELRLKPSEPMALLVFRPDS